MAAQNLLTDTTIRTAKPVEKPIRLNDGAGLYVCWYSLMVQSGGGLITARLVSAKLYHSEHTQLLH
ncbi:MAG: hypothetical protein RIR18_657 [Pseudomonadota bacterium]|jgi:hypothetical protein